MKSSSRSWVLLRGLAREKGHWGPFLDRFQETFAGENVLAIDLPGTGEFRQTPSPADMGAIFRFVRGKVIERAPAGARLHLVAISLGAMVAIEWLRQSPGELGGVVLINTSLKETSPFHLRLRWQIWGRFLKLLSTQAVRVREQAIVDLLMNSEEARVRALPLWTKLALERPVTYQNFFRQLLAAARFSGLSQRPDVPVMLLSGLGDRLVDPSCSTALARRWGLPIERHPWAGHDLPWDDAEWVLNKIKMLA